jgi:hypothetical protein
MNFLSPLAASSVGGDALILAWIISAGGGFLIGKIKGRPGLGLALGLFLGFLGWILITIIPGESRTKEVPASRLCPKCRRVIRKGTLKCQHCMRPGTDSPKHAG